MRSILFLALVLVGCGGSSTSDPAGNTGGGSGSGGNGAIGGTSGSGATGGTAGTGAVSGSGGTGALTGSCTDYLDDPLPLNPITIRIKNEKSVPIYLGGDNGTCGPTELYEIAGPNGPVTLHAGGCGFTCQGLQQHGDECPDSCFLPPTIYIAPGGSYDQTWDTGTYPTAAMPTECYFEPQFAYDSCYQRKTAPPGDYVVAVDAGTQVTCLDIGICSCEPDATGSCQIPYGATPSGETVAAKTSFSMPALDVIEITVQ